MPTDHSTDHSTDRSTGRATPALSAQRWQQVLDRDANADGLFFYGVITTGVYCYPSCPSRQARRENVRFYETRLQATADGLRACKRCRSDSPPLARRQRALVESACKLLARQQPVLKIDEIATRLEISRFHLQRLVKAQTGLSPKAFQLASRRQQLADTLAGSARVTDAIARSGYESFSPFYRDADQVLGMKPAAATRGSTGEIIHYAFGQSSLGQLLMGRTGKGVCAVLLGPDQTELLQDLQRRFPKATLEHDDTGKPDLLQAVIDHVDQHPPAATLPLDIRGTAFQERVWTALRAIPTGETVSYQQLAASIDRPTAARAVAQACGANPVAVIVPCHRVVRSNGDLSGYRWGIEIKANLLKREQRDTERSAAHDDTHDDTHEDTPDDTHGDTGPDGGATLG